MRWTRSASWIQCKQRFSWRLGRVSLPRTRWKHLRLRVASTATTSAADGNIPCRRPSVEWLHCLAMGMRRSWLLWNEPTKQSLLPVRDVWRVQIYPVWAQDAGQEDVPWQHAQDRRHRAALPKLQRWGWHPEARGWHARWSGSRGVITTHSWGYQMEWQSPTF